MKLSRTILHIAKILKLVSEKPDGITLNKICEKLSVLKTSDYDIVTALVQTGAIHVVKERKQHYTIDPTACRIGVNYTNNLDFISTINPMLEAFSREVGETVLFGTCVDDAIIYICKSEPENPIATTVTIDTRNPIYCTSLGRTIMAFIEEEEVRRVLERITFKRHTGWTPGAREGFERELEWVRRKRYAFNTREPEECMEYVGTPVLGQGGNVMGTISISSLYKPTEDYDALRRWVQAKAAEISRLLGLLGKY